MALLPPLDPDRWGLPPRIHDPFEPPTAAPPNQQLPHPPPPYEPPTPAPPPTLPPGEEPTIGIDSGFGDEFLQSLFEEFNVSDELQKFFEPYKPQRENFARTGFQQQFQSRQGSTRNTLMDFFDQARSTQSQRGFMAGIDRDLLSRALQRQSDQFRQTTDIAQTALDEDIFNLRERFREESFQRVIDLMESGALVDIDPEDVAEDPFEPPIAGTPRGPGAGYPGEPEDPNYDPPIAGTPRGPGAGFPGEPEEPIYDPPIAGSPRGPGAGFPGEPEGPEEEPPIAGTPRGPGAGYPEEPEDEPPISGTPRGGQRGGGGSNTNPRTNMLWNVRNGVFF